MSIDSTEIDDDLRAAEFVLGLLDVSALREAEARLRNDPSFAAEVAEWAERFAPWLALSEPVEPPSELWPRIRALLWGHELPRRSAIAARRPPVWQNLALWRGLAIGGLTATVASLLLLTFAFHRPLPPASPPVVVARSQHPTAAPMAVVMRLEDGSIAYTATLDATGTFVVTPVQPHPDPRAPELWLIPPGDRPHSLGMLPRERTIAVRVPAALLTVARNSLFAVSLEPPGSGPHEAPTGPVVAKGDVTAL